MPGEGPAERELQRLGGRCAAVLRLAVALLAVVLVLAVAPSGPAVGAVVALNVWSLLLMSRPWPPVADVAVVSLACLTQQWTVPPDVLHGNTSWVAAVVSIAVPAWQWQGHARVGVVATAAAVLAYLVGAGMVPTSWLVVTWLGVEAALSRGLYHLVRAGARETDRAMADAERVRRDAAVAAARRADERAHLAAIHDTAAATLLAIGAGTVHGREPWLVRQLSAALDDVTDGVAELLPLIEDLVRHSPAPAELSCVDDVPPLPGAVAVAVGRAVGEALRNVARHAGAGTVAAVRVAARPGGVVVEVTDDGVGFDPARVPSHRRGVALSLVERMAAVGGRAVVTSSPGHGTRVRLEWPDG